MTEHIQVSHACIRSEGFVVEHQIVKNTVLKGPIPCVSSSFFLRRANDPLAMDFSGSGPLTSQVRQLLQDGPMFQFLCQRSFHNHAVDGAVTLPAVAPMVEGVMKSLGRPVSPGEVYRVWNEHCDPDMHHMSLAHFEPFLACFAAGLPAKRRCASRGPSPPRSDPTAAGEHWVPGDGHATQRGAAKHPGPGSGAQSQCATISTAGTSAGHGGNTQPGANTTGEAAATAATAAARRTSPTNPTQPNQPNKHNIPLLRGVGKPHPRRKLKQIQNL